MVTIIRVNLSTLVFKSALDSLGLLHCHACFRISFISSTINPVWILVKIALNFQIFGGKLSSLKCWVCQSINMVYLPIRISFFFLLYLYLLNICFILFNVYYFLYCILVFKCFFDIFGASQKYIIFHCWLC